MKTKRQRQQHDDVWNLMVQACGGRCCVCGAADSKLQRGHIQRHADAGGDDLSNLIPICKPCNAKYSRSLLTPDTRPVDWKSNFVRLLIQHFGIRMTWRTTSGRGQPHSGAIAGENTAVIPLEDIDFVTDSRYLPTSWTAPTAPTPEAIVEAVDQLIREGRKHRVPIPGPVKRTLDDMHRLARVHGLKTFLAAGRQFLDAEEWYDASGDVPVRTMKGTEWVRFCDNFSGYRTDYTQRLAREARQAEEDRKEAEVRRQREEADRLYRQTPEYQREQAALYRQARLRDLTHNEWTRGRELSNMRDSLRGAVKEIDRNVDAARYRLFEQAWNLTATMYAAADSDMDKYLAEYERLLDLLRTPSHTADVV